MAKAKDAQRKIEKRETRTPIRRIGVVVPAHNEAALIDACLRSIDRAAAHALTFRIDVTVHVVCDACSDDTAARVVAHGFQPLTANLRNVGAARAMGAGAALAAGADWLAFTDADTRVSPTWLIDQVALDADAFCGTIGVDDWGHYGAPMRAHFSATYHDVEHHRHIHGANFGISAAAYRATGGFEPLASHEDVALVESLIAADFNIAWSAVPRVTTSARADYRAPEGFGATLERVGAAFVETTQAARKSLGELLPEVRKVAGA
jgi:glycosyltransferase involved in cell wall biosynthesis